MKLLIFRTILIYLCVLFAMRLMGKRQLGELQPEELVSTILISNLASISIESEEVPVTASLIPLFLIAALELLGSILSFRSQKFFNLMSGRPKTVILNGEIDQDALRTLRLTTADLMEALRGKDVFDPRDVSYAVVETNGNLSVALRPEKETTTLADLRLNAERTQATIPFVLDGQILDDNLHWCGKDRAWLERTAEANTLLVEEILLLIGNDTEDYFLLKKQPRRRRERRSHEAHLRLSRHRGGAARHRLLQQLPGAAIRRGDLGGSGQRYGGHPGRRSDRCAASPCRRGRAVRPDAGRDEPPSPHRGLHRAGSRPPRGGRPLGVERTGGSLR